MIFALFFSLTLLTAAVMDLFFPTVQSSFHPVLLQGKYINFLWKHRPSGRTGLLLYGGFIVISGSVLSFSAAYFIQRFIIYLLTGAAPSSAASDLLNRAAASVSAGSLRVVPISSAASGVFFILITGAALGAAFVLKAAFSFKILMNIALDISEALKEGKIIKARKLLSYHLVSRDTSELDESAVASAVIESVSENFADSVAGPFFWFVFAGLGGAWLFRFADTADSMLGYRDGDREYGGKAAARFDDLMCFVPARAAGLAICVAAGGAEKRREAAEVLKKYAKVTPSPNSGFPMSAAAGALGVRLEKKGEYVINSSGRTPSAGSTGSGKTEENDIEKTVKLLYRAFFILLAPSLPAAAVIGAIKWLLV